jgi:CRP-like cAMP-binding protein
MPDLLDRIRDDVEARLRQLRPAAEEYERLRHVRDELAGIAKAGRRQAGRAAFGSASQQRRPVPRGERTRQLLGMLGDSPELTPTKLALMLDTTRENVSVTLARLKKQGVISREGSAWVILRQPE